MNSWTEHWEPPRSDVHCCFSPVHWLCTLCVFGCISVRVHVVSCVFAGGFRLKYAASHISEALDNADWRGRNDEEEFRRSGFHSDGPLFFHSSVCEQRTEASGKKKKGESEKHWEKERATCQGLSGWSLSTCAWENLVTMEMIHCLVHSSSPRDSRSLPFQFVFDIFALRVGND